MRRSLIFFVLFSLDFFSKAYVHHFLPLMGWNAPVFPYGGIGVFEDFFGIEFSINHVINRGAAWGLFANFQTLLFYARVGIVGVLVFYFFFFKKAQKTPLLLIITGALGNILDHLVYGHVVDMFYFRLWDYSFPVFNVADACIFLGIAALLLHSFFKKRHVAPVES